MGFTFEELVASRYLAALLLESSAPGTQGITVSAVALQQRDFGEPLDDVIVDSRGYDGQLTRLSLQVKRTLRISAASSNTDFRELIRDSLLTLNKATFRDGIDRYGGSVGTISSRTFRTLTTLCELARASSSTEHFEERFAEAGNANSRLDRMKQQIESLLTEYSGTPCDGALLHRFLRHFLLIQFDYLHDGATDSAEGIEVVRAALADPTALDAANLWRFLGQIAREGAGRSAQFSRTSLVNLLVPTFRLRGAPSFRKDVAQIESLTRTWILDIDDDVRGARLDRSELMTQLDRLVAAHRFVQIRGLPGSGKSVLLRRRIEAELEDGSVLLLKSGRLEGRSWSTFATAIGLTTKDPIGLLVELEATGSCTLFIDGVDRIERQHQSVVVDVVRAIVREPLLARWKIVISLRDAGAEPLRTWLPDFFESGGIATLDVGPLSDVEATQLAEARPELARVLFGPPTVREIVRRPFFAKILSESLAQGTRAEFAPRSEIDLLENWWSRGGFNATGTEALRRQRAIVELGASRVRNLSHPLLLGSLTSPTVDAIPELIRDGILQAVRAGHSVRFSHDIFFEWALYHRLVDCGPEWMKEIEAAGEPPVIARVVELLSQAEFLDGETWPTTLKVIHDSSMRSQWTRAWLLGPISAPNFEEHEAQFYDVLAQDKYQLLRKALVWFQAERTVPNPTILDGRSLSASLKREEIIRLADLLGWPSDFEAWRRWLVLLLRRVEILPINALPEVIILFQVWQNAFADIQNGVSTALLNQCKGWLSEIERDRHCRTLAPQEKPSRWSKLGKDLEDFEHSLRQLLLRGARAEVPLIASYLVELGADKDRLDSAFKDVIAFSPILANTHTQQLVDLTLVHLKEELPQERREREQEEERQALERIKRDGRSSRGPMGFPRRSFNQFSWDELSIDRDRSEYLPASPLREPFRSLFEFAPAQALSLVRDLSNHAMTAWRQLHRIDPERRATPIPLTLEFPWGVQSFWGNTREYFWSRGVWAPKPLACAYLALEEWAFKELERGKSSNQLIEEILKENESMAVVGTAVTITLQSLTVSEMTWPLVTSQRLWRYDLERLVQESSLASGSLIGFTNPTTDRPHAVAVDAMNKRPVRKLWLRQLVASFVLSADAELAKKTREAIAAFPENLPFEYEEQRDIERVREPLLRDAKFEAEFAKPENYRILKGESSDEQVVILENPEAQTPEARERSERSAEHLRIQSVWFWANNSFERKEISQDIDPGQAIEFVKRRDDANLFDGSRSIEAEMRRAAVAGVAAVVLKFRDRFGANDLTWARGVVNRAAKMPELADSMWNAMAIVPWHPGISAAQGLSSEICSGDHASETRTQLFRLIAHPLDAVSLAALKAALSLAKLEPKLAWCALWQALSLCQFEIDRGNPGARQYDPDYIAGKQAQIATEAIIHFESSDNWPDLPRMPPAWILATQGELGEEEGIEEEEDMDPVARRRRWKEPDSVWNWYYGEKVLGLIPYEEVLRPETREQFLRFAKDLLDWVIRKIAPPWKIPGRRERGQNFFELDSAVGHMFAMLAAQLDTATFASLFLESVFQLEDENCFALLAPFVDRYVRASIMDAPEIPKNGIELLEHCLVRVLKGSTFDPTTYYAGELNGWDLSSLTRSLLFVSVERADRASRFANGDWGEINIILPLVDCFVRAAGWSSEFMDSFLTLCERASATYPADDFAGQVLTILTAELSLKGWRGSLLPARIAGLVQNFASRETPMNIELAQKFLRILDILVDMGDRRSAALQISDSFREVRASIGEV